MKVYNNCFFLVIEPGWKVQALPLLAKKRKVAERLSKLYKK